MEYNKTTGLVKYVVSTTVQDNKVNLCSFYLLQNIHNHTEIGLGNGHLTIELV